MLSVQESVSHISLYRAGALDVLHDLLVGKGLSVEGGLFTAGGFTSGLFL